MVCEVTRGNMSKYAQHQKTLYAFMFALQKEIPEIRIFGRHVGMFYKQDGSPIKINRKGMADLWAIYPLAHCLIHMEFEVKTKTGKQTENQKKWQRFIESRKGLYLVVREDYRSAIVKTKEFINESERQMLLR